MMISCVNPKQKPIRTDGRMENPEGVTKVPGGRVERTLYKDMVPHPSPYVKKSHCPVRQSATVSRGRPGDLYTHEPLRHDHVQYSIGAIAETLVALGVRLARARRACITCEDRTYGRHSIQFSPHHDRPASRRPSALLWQYRADHAEPGPHCRWWGPF